MNWTDILPTAISDMAHGLARRAAGEIRAGTQIYPPVDQIFRALALTPPDRTKVVILGQDPYHTPGQANGLAFSVASGNPLQPSLQNIFQVLQADVGCPRPLNGDLTPWAEQGVLLLNTSLTVYRGRPNSCADWGWETFTRAVFMEAMKLPQPVCFILWGAKAIDFASGMVPGPDKLLLMSSHPSPYSVSKPCRRYPAFIQSRPFSRANEFLVANGVRPVDWDLAKYQASPVQDPMRGGVTE